MPNFKHLVFVLNPISGGKEKETLVSYLRDQSEKMGFRYEIWKTTGNNDVEKLEKFLNHKSPDCVVSIGGDGTLNMVSRVLHAKKVPLGIIPFGSANGLATDLTIPVNYKRAFKLLFEGGIKEIDAVKINGTYISFHLSDIGLNARMIRNFEKEGERGIINYGKQFLREIFKAKRIRFDIEVDGVMQHHSAYMIVIANASKYGTGAIINPRGKIDDGKFEIIVVKPLPPQRFMNILWKKTIQHDLKDEFFAIYSTTKALIKNRKKQYLQIDGEVVGKPKEITVEIIPQYISVITPADKD